MNPENPHQARCMLAHRWSTTGPACLAIALLLVLAALAMTTRLASGTIDANRPGPTRVLPLANATYGGGSDPSRTQDTVALVSWRTNASRSALTLWIDVEDFSCRSDSEALFVVPRVVITARGTFSVAGAFADGPPRAQPRCGLRSRVILCVPTSRREPSRWPTAHVPALCSPTSPVTPPPATAQVFAAPGVFTSAISRSARRELTYSCPSCSASPRRASPPAAGPSPAQPPGSTCSDRHLRRARGSTTSIRSGSTTRCLGPHSATASTSP